MIGLAGVGLTRWNRILVFWKRYRDRFRSRVKTDTDEAGAKAKKRKEAGHVLFQYHPRNSENLQKSMSFDRKLLDFASGQFVVREWIVIAVGRNFSIRRGRKRETVAFSSPGCNERAPNIHAHLTWTRWRGKKIKKRVSEKECPRGVYPLGQCATN